MAGYTRVATANIANGQVVDATYLNNEFNAIETAMGTGGHVHDGTAGNGPKLTLVTATSGTLTLAQGGLGLSSAQFSAAGMLAITSAAGAFGAYNVGQGLKLSSAQLQHDFTGSGAIAISAANITINVSAPLAVSGSSLQLNYAATLKVSGGLLDVVSVATSAATAAEITTGTSTTAYLSPSTAIAATYGNARNYVINPEGYIFQRTAPTADNAYAWDRWRLLLGAANAATVSQNTTSMPTGVKNAMRLTVGSGNNNKFGVFQIIEGVDVYSLRGKTVCLNAYIKATAGITDVRMAVVEWTGTEDATSGDPISAWNTMATVPTYAAGWANLNTPANLSVTTSFVQYNVTATIGASATNLAVFIWSEDTSNTQTTDILDVTAIMLTIGGVPHTYHQRSYAEELGLCRRYCLVLADTGTGSQPPVDTGAITSTTGTTVVVKFPSTMRAPPTFSVSSVAHFQINSTAGQAACNGLTLAASTPVAARLAPTQAAASLTAGQSMELLFNDTSAKLTFTAEL